MRRSFILRRRRGQALVELAISLAVLVMIVTTGLSLVPAIQVRGEVFAAARVALQRVIQFEPSSGPNAGGSDDAQRLCDEMLRSVRGELGAMPGMTPDTPLDLNPSADTALSDITSDCTSGSSQNPRVWIESVTGPDGSSNAPLLPGAQVTACTAFDWTPNQGILLILAPAIGTVSTTTISAFHWQYCGEATIETYRSR